MLGEATIAEAQSAVSAELSAQAEPVQQPKLNGRTKNGSLLVAVLGLIGALASAGIPLWLFYVRWPVEREQMLTETLKTVEETAQTKLSEELTKTQVELTRLDALIKEVEQRYAEPLKRLQLQTAEQQGKLVNFSVYKPP